MICTFTKRRKRRTVVATIRRLRHTLLRSRVNNQFSGKRTRAVQQRNHSFARQQSKMIVQESLSIVMAVIVSMFLMPSHQVAQAIQLQEGHVALGSYPGYSGYAAAPAIALHAAPRKPLRQSEKEQQQDLSKVPGVPGHDYPIYHSVPDTSFSCEHVPHRPGMYANVDTGCQAYHVCHDGREGKQGSKFLCTNGTLFNQEKFTCDWWYNVNCNEAVNHYSLNLDPAKNPYYAKPKVEPEQHQRPSHYEPTGYQQPAYEYEPDYYHK